MKHSSLLAPLFLAGLAGLIASSNGVAEEQGRDRTGAPGSDPVCTSCHNNAGSSVTAAFEVLDGNTQEVVTAYTPGQDYLVRMVIVGGDAGMSYGVQGTAVSNDGANAGTFVSVSDNAQLEDVNGRHIVEHSSPSASSSFDATWTAPVAGSGAAGFYMSALAVNGNGTTGGDMYAAATFTLPEAGGTSVGESHIEEWTRPAAFGGDLWTWTAPEKGRLVVADLAGRVLHTSNLSAQQRTEWAADGMIVVSFVADNGSRQAWKMASR